MMFILAALTVAMMLLIWFKTDAFAEYMCLFRLDRFFALREYGQMKQVNPALFFPDFLLEFKNTFLSRLFSCPICVSVWFGLLVAAVFAMLKMCLAVSFTALILYEAYLKITNGNQSNS